jgi:hypothetical protein
VAVTPTGRYLVHGVRSTRSGRSDGAIRSDSDGELGQVLVGKRDGTCPNVLDRLGQPGAERTVTRPHGCDALRVKPCTTLPCPLYPFLGRFRLFRRTRRAESDISRDSFSHRVSQFPPFMNTLPLEMVAQVPAAPGSRRGEVPSWNTQLLSAVILDFL